MRVFQFCSILLCAAVLMLSSGCGGTNDGKVDVSGKVTLDGAAVEGATVTIRADGGEYGSGRTRADGTYTMRLKPGEYKVQITKKDISPVDPAKIASGSGPDAKAPSQNAAPPKDLLPKKYGAYSSSGLTVSVTGAMADCNFDLTEK